MSEQQEEALLLADALEDEAVDWPTGSRAAAELRRLHAEIEKLKKDVETWQGCAGELGRQLAALRKQKPVEKKSGEPPVGFARFWNAWPSNSRKVNKKACLTRWISAGLEAKTEDIIAHVDAMRCSRDWTKDGGAYIPAPLVYLNQERYLAPLPAQQSRPGSLAGIQYTQQGITHDGRLD